MHRRQRHLNAHGDGLQPREGLPCAVLCFCFPYSPSYFPASISFKPRLRTRPINLFKNALKKTEKGDLDGAIEDYSRAIVLSSRLDTRQPAARLSGHSFTASDAVDVVDDSSDIRVIDPFTANAYNNRGLLRYRKGDYSGALADYNEALRIRPGLAAAYLNRAAALVATGEKSNALKRSRSRHRVEERFLSSVQQPGQFESRSRSRQRSARGFEPRGRIEQQAWPTRFITVATLISR